MTGKNNICRSPTRVAAPPIIYINTSDRRIRIGLTHNFIQTIIVIGSAKKIIVTLQELY